MCVIDHKGKILQYKKETGISFIYMQMRRSQACAMNHFYSLSFVLVGYVKKYMNFVPKFNGLGGS